MTLVVYLLELQRKMFRLFLLLMSVISVNTVHNINRQIVNKNVERSIDLTSQLVQISIVITFENTGKDSIDNYLIVLEPSTQENLSFMSVKSTRKEDLKVTPKEIGQNNSFYNVQLKQPLTEGQTTDLNFNYVLTNSLSPYPRTIAQKETQLVRYFGNHYFYTPYNTSRQVTTVTLSSNNIESYTNLKPVYQSDTDTTITYGPYNDIPAFTFDEMVIHFENHSPFLTVTRLERFIEVSHWGNLAVEENVEILHTGAKLKGSFSMFDYQRDTSVYRNNHHSIRSYRTFLPCSAHSIYYRDSIGNISTSALRPNKQWFDKFNVELVLRPRFPLFGGWRSAYTMGYSLPSHQYLYKTRTGEYVLKIKLLGHVFDDMHVAELETSILLPVGASEVLVKTPYEMERLPDSVTYKYFGKIGRKLIRFRKSNLVEYHIQNVEIRYKCEAYHILHSPLCITIALLIFFVFMIVYQRLDFSIQKQKMSKNKE